MKDHKDYSVFLLIFRPIELTSHKRTHHDSVVNLKCHFCTKSFENNGFLKEHIETKHRDLKDKKKEAEET